MKLYIINERRKDIIGGVEVVVVFFIKVLESDGVVVEVVL